jgi:hypothetical protein
MENFINSFRFKPVRFGSKPIRRTGVDQDLVLREKRKREKQRENVGCVNNILIKTKKNRQFIAFRFFRAAPP